MTIMTAGEVPAEAEVITNGTEAEAEAIGNNTETGHLRNEDGSGRGQKNSKGLDRSREDQRKVNQFGGGHTVEIGPQVVLVIQAE